MGYLAGGPIASVARTPVDGAATYNGQNSIPVPGGFQPGMTDVFVGGVRLSPGDFDDSDGMQVKLAKGMAAGTQYAVTAWNGGGLSVQPVAGQLASFRNKLINGNFDIWQRGTSVGASTSNKYLADRFYSYSVGSTVAQARQAFPLGQTDVPGNPRYFNRITVASVAGAANQANYAQVIEDVTTLAGRQAVLSFWMRADAPKNIAVEFAQVFDAGSPDVLGIGVTTCALTTAWKQFKVPVTLPSVAGKSTGGGNHGVYVLWWFDAGSNSNSRTNNLGQQSGVFDIARAQFEPGSVATSFEDRPTGLEFSLCQRYCQKYFNFQTAGYGAAGGNVSCPFMMFQQTMRTTPTLTHSNETYGSCTGLTWSAVYPHGAQIFITGASANLGCWAQHDVLLSAEF